jgi:hypothetical protein
LPSWEQFTFQLGACVSTSCQLHANSMQTILGFSGSLTVLTPANHKPLVRAIASFSGGKGLAKKGFLSDCQSATKLLYVEVPGSWTFLLFVWSRCHRSSFYSLVSSHPKCLTMPFASGCKYVSRYCTQVSLGCSLAYVHPSAFELQGGCTCLTWACSKVCRCSQIFLQACFQNVNPSDARTKSREINARFWSSRNLKRKTWNELRKSVDYAYNV